MKKSIVKSLSAFLALVLILSVLPMAAFAAEVGEHEHTGSCCEENIAMPAMAICPEGEHIYRVTTSSRMVDCGGVHRVDEVTLYKCAKCNHSYVTPTGASYYAAHRYTKTQVGVDPDSGLKIYLYACACGNSYYAN